MITLKCGKSAMTVRDLVDKLLEFDQDLPVAYKCHSEAMSLLVDDLTVEEWCDRRGDGWLERKRPDKFSREYLMFPGN